MRYQMVSAVAALLIAINVGVAQQDGKKIKATQVWSGKIVNIELSKKAPKAGFLTDQKAFEELWKASRSEEKLPVIDFAKHLVIVQVAAGGPNIPSSSYTLTGEGDLKARTASTLLAGPGFGYSIDVLNKEGIKTYQGKKVE